MAGMIILLSMVMLVLFIAATEKYVMPIAANICLTEAKERSSAYITEKLVNMENNEVKIPYGAASGIAMFANSGPEISFRIKPVGGTDVDYKTEFMSAGINQTNYKIWLTVNITVSLANPIYSKNVNMTRKIMLVDTVIKGEVPSSYLGVPHS